MRTLVLLLLALFVAGCATNKDDQAFFEQGWVKPQRGAEQRMFGEHGRGAAVAGDEAPPKEN